MQPPQLDSATNEIEVLAQCEQWVLVKSNEPLVHFTEKQFFIVWIDEPSPDQTLLNACQKLANTPGLFIGLKLTFEDKPELGFVLDSSKGWGFETPDLTQKTLEKIIWELNRLCRE